MFKVAVVGATGAVGRELLSILETRRFPVEELLPFASPRSQGQGVRLGDRTFPARVLQPGCFAGVDFAFFDASDAVSREWAPQAAQSGAWVIDNAATFRMDEDIPLLVPEVNGEILERRLARGAKGLAPRERILTGPNCSTVQMVVALKPIRDLCGLRRVVVSTYQSVSGAGTAAMDELSRQTAGHLGGPPVAPQAFPHQIAFNCIPHIGGFAVGPESDGYTGEERKIIAETRKLLGLPDLRVSATAVRVPTLSCHGESVNVECERPFEIADVRSALARQAGLIVQDDPAAKLYPMGSPGAASAVEGASGRDAVYVGRLRRDPSLEHGLNFWVVSDNLRKGAALNAVQIGEMLVRHFA